MFVKRDGGGCPGEEEERKNETEDPINNELRGRKGCQERVRNTGATG